ncbi:MAG TPA: M56 family metallopeptidase [Terracidiphilus sp.]|jgi:beta-lactamase regulating signal transducer with metallopeptidase domain
MTHTLQAIAWTLIHFSWQAAAIAGLYAVANKVMMRPASQVTSRTTSHARYLLALGALLAMLASSAVTFTWQMLPSEPATPMVGATERAGDFPRIAEPGIAPRGAAVSASQVADAIASVEPAARYMLWIDALWVLGVCGLSVRNFGGWWMIHRLRTQASGLVPTEVEAAFARIASALKLHQKVILRVSDLVAGPVTVGALRAVVLLPLSAVTSLGPDELEVVLAHELAHVKRADFLWNLVQTVMETLFFFHPAVWWVSGRVRHERELCCDDLALSVCPNPVVYASALYRLEEQRSRQMHLAMALDGHQTRQTLRMRIARILGDASAPEGRNARPFSITAVVMGVAVLLLSAPQVVSSLHAMEPVAVAAPAMTAAAPATPMTKAVVANSVTRTATSTVTNTATMSVVAQAATAAAKPQASEQNDEPAQASESHNDGKPHTNYIDAMKAAGYDVDLDKLIAMKVQDVTPEYAKAMAQLGFGKPSADELIACKVQGVSPEAIAKMKQQGFEVKSLQDAISFKIFDVTPEFISSMKAAGFEIDSKQAVTLRVQGVTPEYARGIKQQFPNVTVDDLVQTKIFNIDADFIAQAKKHGFNDLSLKRLVQLRISGIMDDESK